MAPWRLSPILDQARLAQGSALHSIVQGAAAPHHRFDLPIAADMLRSLAGRDLLLMMGSEAAKDVIYDLTGRSRLWNAVWHSPDRLLGNK